MKIEHKYYLTIEIEVEDTGDEEHDWKVADSAFEQAVDKIFDHLNSNDDVLTWKVIDEEMKCAEGKSVIGVKPEREGLVFKSLSVPNVSFKVISNRWLLKNEG